MSVQFFSIFLLVLTGGLLQGCYQLRQSQSSSLLSNTSHQTRLINADDIKLPEGYQIRAVAHSLTHPTASVVDDQGQLYVIEAGSSAGHAPLLPKLLRVKPNGSLVQIAEGHQDASWTGLSFHGGYFYVAEGGAPGGGRILRISRQGQITPLVSNISSTGSHVTNGPVVLNGYVYFGQGIIPAAADASVSLYNHWLFPYPQHNGVILEGVTSPVQRTTTASQLIGPTDEFTTGIHLSVQEVTGEYPAPGGTGSGQGAILRVPLQGGTPEVIAWGLRNPYGLAVSPQQELFITESSYNLRGNRPVWGNGDVLWQIKPGAWYGWPDVSGGVPSANLQANEQPDPLPLLARHPNKPPRPAAHLGAPSFSNGLDFSRSSKFGFAGEAFIVQSGNMAPPVAKEWQPVGFKIVRVNVVTGKVEEFAANKATDGPASLHRSGGLERPISVTFSPRGDALYVVDAGILTTTAEGAQPVEKTGVIWMITKKK